MRICCVVASMGSGGAERVMTELCRAWNARGDKVTLVTLDDERKDFYAVPPGVERVALGVSGVSTGAAAAMMANAQRMRAVRRAVLSSRPDIVVSFIDRTNVLVLLSMRGTAVPIVVSERNDPRVHEPGRAWRALRRIAYPTADGLVVQTPGLVPWASGFLPPRRVHVIPNPVRSVAAVPNHACRKPGQMVAMGRLVAQKGFDTLIQAFAVARAVHPEWNLTIHGEGPLRTELSSLVSRLDLDGHVSLPGRINDADSMLREASIFVLSSRYEGFPNVLLEACVAGCACIATDCRSGPSDIIEDGRSGLLVPVDDVDALAKAMCALMSNPQLRTTLGDAAMSGTSRFSIERVIADWDRAFASAMSPERVAA